jgi:hypothetical protein
MEGRGGPKGGLQQYSEDQGIDMTLVSFVYSEIDTLELHKTEKIETELKDVERIRAYRCTQHCPGCPSEACIPKTFHI